MTKSEKHITRAALKSHKADLDAERMFGENVKELCEATNAFRAGEITQDAWFNVRGKFLGEEYARPPPCGVLDTRNGIREVSDDLFPDGE